VGQRAFAIVLEGDHRRLCDESVVSDDFDRSRFVVVVSFDPNIDRWGGKIGPSAPEHFPDTRLDSRVGDDGILRSRVEVDGEVGVLTNGVRNACLDGGV
jgi:hypothetical protein